MSTEITTVSAAAAETNERFRNTLNLTTVEGKKATVNALNNAMSLNDYNDTPLTIVDIITSPGVRKGRNGQADTPCQNTYLIDVEGRAYFTQSDGIARSANAILTMFDVAEIHSGIPMKVSAAKLANGNTIKSLELL